MATGGSIARMLFSRTIFVAAINLLVGLTSEDLRDWIKDNPDLYIQAVTIIMVVMRVLTEIKFKKEN